MTNVTMTAAGKKFKYIANLPDGTTDSSTRKGDHFTHAVVAKRSDCEEWFLSSMHKNEALAAKQHDDLNGRFPDLSFETQIVTIEK